MGNSDSISEPQTRFMLQAWKARLMSTCTMTACHWQCAEMEAPLLQVSGILLGRQARLKLQTEESSAPDGPFKPQLGINRITNKAGRLDQEQLAQAAAWSFELALSAMPDSPCVLLESHCSAVQQHDELLRSKNADADQMRASKAALQNCYNKLSSSGCRTAGV